MNKKSFSKFQIESTLPIFSNSIPTFNWFINKKCIPNHYLNFLKNENEDINNEAKSRNKMKLLNNLKLTDIKGNIINAKDAKVKIMQNILHKKSLPKYQDKWNNF
jgi:hypothetical protein